MYAAYNEVTRKMEEIDITLAELVAGQTVTRYFWCKSAKRWVTVPGASLYEVSDSGALQLMI